MAALRVQDPVRVRAIGLAVLVDHLELDPEAEFHAERVDALREARDAVRQAVGIRPPVAEAARLAAARGEPAIVEDEELDADIVRRLGDAHELLLIEIEVRGLPIVDEDGAHLVAPDTARQARAVELVEVLAHAVEAVVRLTGDVASGVWNESDGASCQQNSCGWMPIVTRVTSKVSTSACARKLPL